MLRLQAAFYVVVSQKRAAGEGERPEPVKTHLRNMIIIPEMIGSIIGVYNGKVFMPVEVKVCVGRNYCSFVLTIALHGRAFACVRVRVCVCVCVCVRLSVLLRASESAVVRC